MRLLDLFCGGGLRWAITGRASMRLWALIFPTIRTTRFNLYRATRWIPGTVVSSMRLRRLRVRRLLRWRPKNFR